MSKKINASVVTERTTQESRITDTFKTSLATGPAGEFDEIPMGFGMALAMNPLAWNAYSAMTTEQKQSILKKARDAETKEQMHRIVNNLAAQ